MNIFGGVSTSRDDLYVLSEASTADEDDRSILSGIVLDNSVLLRKRLEAPDVVSIIALTGSVEELGQAAVMSGEGKVVFFSEETLREEQIPGAGYSGPQARKLGRMTTLKQTGGKLFALGFGGQAYVREPNGWRYLDGPSAVPSRPNANVCWLTVTEWRGRLIFGGTSLTDTEDTPEMEEADEAGDSDRWAELVLAAAVPDVTAAWEYDGEWRQIEIDYLGAISEMLPDNNSVLLFTTKGRILSTPDFVQFDDVFSFERQGSFSDIKALPPAIVTLCNNALWKWVGEIQPFEPPLPAIDDEYLNVWGRRESAFAFSSARIFHLRGDAWKEVVYTTD